MLLELWTKSWTLPNGVGDVMYKEVCMHAYMIYESM